MSQQDSIEDFLLTIKLETSQGNGQDDSLFLTYGDNLLIAVFDGMGGRSGLIGDEQGAKVASRTAKEATRTFFAELGEKDQRLDKTNFINLQNYIQFNLKKVKSDAEKNVTRTSKVKGFKNTLQKDKLATTLALVSISESQDKQYNLDLDVAWMGDSRIYFLSPQKGLQQLSRDDLEEYQNAFDSTFKTGSPMSQYLTPNLSANKIINFKREQIEEENGLVIVCTDGAFEGLYPWQFEWTLLHYLLQEVSSLSEWQVKLSNYYQERRVGDDVTLLLFPISDSADLDRLKLLYNERYEELLKLKDNENPKELEQIWMTYRKNYEERMTSGECTSSTLEVSSSYVSADLAVIRKFNNIQSSLESGSKDSYVSSGVENFPARQSEQQTFTSDLIIKSDANSQLAVEIEQDGNSSPKDKIKIDKTQDIAHDKDVEHRVFINSIQNLLLSEDYDGAIKSLNSVKADSDQYIPVLSYLMLASIKKEQQQRIKLLSLPNQQKNKYEESFQKICDLIKTQQLLESNSFSPNLSLEILVEVLSQLDINEFQKINFSKNISLIHEINSKLNQSEGGNQNPYLMELQGKILRIELISQIELKQDIASQLEKIKDYFDQALILYERQSNEKRMKKCSEYLKDLEPPKTIMNILNKKLF